MMAELVGIVKLNNSVWQCLRSQNLLCDMEVNVYKPGMSEFHTFQCHKIILMAASRFFSGQIEKNPWDRDIILPTIVTPLSFEIILDCIYGEPFSQDFMRAKCGNLGQSEIELVFKEVQASSKFLGLNVILEKWVGFEVEIPLSNFPMHFQLKEDLVKVKKDDVDSWTEEDSGLGSDLMVTPGNLNKKPASVQKEDSAIRKSLRLEKYDAMPLSRCPICNTIIKAGKQHKCENQKRFSIPTVPKPIECKICGKVFKLKGCLKNHFKIHMQTPNDVKNTTCSVCNKTYNSKYYLDIHLFKDHKMNVGNKKVHQCHLCDFETIDKKAFEAHLTTHSEEKKHQCATCGQSFKLQRILSRHVKDVHGSLTCHCPHCPKIFKSKLRLKRHQNVVHGSLVKNWKCFYCDHKTVLRSNCKTHVRKSHVDKKVEIIDLQLERAVRD